MTFGERYSLATEIPFPGYLEERWQCSWPMGLPGLQVALKVSEIVCPGRYGLRWTPCPPDGVWYMWQHRTRFPCRATHDSSVNTPARLLPPTRDWKTPTLQLNVLTWHISPEIRTLASECLEEDVLERAKCCSYLWKKTFPFHWRSTMNNSLQFTLISRCYLIHLCSFRK